MSPPFRETEGFRHEIRSPLRFGDDLHNDHRIRLRSDESGEWRHNDRRILANVETDRLEDHHFHDQYHPEMLPREFELNSGGSEFLREPMDSEVLMRGGRDGMLMDDHVNVRYDVQAQSRDVSCSPINFRNRGIDREDGFWEFYEEGLNHGPESGRYHDRGSRQEMQDYSNRTPRKNLRKKSAFLRIQPLKHGTFRNRHDRTPSPHKGKESLEVLDHRLSEERGGSPVELDVSFKSNSLVAKAIVAAPSSSGIGPNDSSTLNDLDIRIDGKSALKVERNRNCRDNTSVSRKVEKHSENIARSSPTLKRGGLLGNKDVCHINSESPSNGSSSLSGVGAHKGSLIGEISDKDYTNAGLGKVPSPNIRKKRKSNVLISRLSSSPAKTNVKLVNVSSSVDTSGCSVSDDGIKETGKESSSGDQVVGSTQNETIMGTENMDVNGSSVVIVQAVGHNVSEAPFRKRMRKKGVLDAPVNSSGPLCCRVSESSGKSNRCEEDLQTISNTDEDVTKLVDNCVSDTSTEGCGHESQIVVPVLVDKGSGEGSAEPFIYVPVNLDNTHILSDDLDKHGTLDAVNSVSSPCDAPIKIQDGVDVTCSVVHADKTCGSQVISSPENSMIGLSCGEEHLDGNNNNHDKTENHDILLNSSEADILSEKTITASSPDAASDFEKLTNDIKERCQGDGTVLVSGVDGEGPSRDFISDGGDFTLFSTGRDASGPALKRTRKSRNELQYVNVGISESSFDTAGNKSFPTMSSNLPVEKLGCIVSSLPSCIAESDVCLQKGLKDSCLMSITSMNHGQDSDAIEYPSHLSKKIKLTPLGSVLSDTSSIQNHDLPAASDSLTSTAEVCLSSNEYSIQSVKGTEPSNSVLVERNVLCGVTASLQTKIYSLAESSNADLPHGNPGLSVNEDACLDEELTSFSSKQEGNVNLVVAGATNGSELIVLESGGRVTANYQSGGAQSMETDHIGDSGCGPLVTETECEDDVAQNDNMPPESDCLQLHAKCNDVATTVDYIGDSGHGPPVMGIESEDDIAVNDNLRSESDRMQLYIECTDDGATTDFNMVATQSIVGSSKAGSLLTHSLCSNTVPALNLLSDGKLGMDARKSSEGLVTPGSLSSQANLLFKNKETNSKPGSSAAEAYQPFAQKNVAPAKNAKSTTSRVNPMGRQLIRRNALVRADANLSSARASPITTPSNKALSMYPVKPRTWRRTDNLPTSNISAKKPFSTAPLQRPPIDKTLKVQSSSYIRKGNSLVRNPAPGAANPGPRVFGASVNQSKPNAANDVSKRTGSPEMIDSTVVPDSLIAGGRNAHVEMLKTPPLPCSVVASDSEIGHSVNCRSSPLVGQSEGLDNEELRKSSDTTPSSSRNPETDVDRSVEDPGTLSDGNFSASDLKRIVYIKRKSNQLIAASNPSKPSLHKMGNTPALSSDNGYYKRRTNQLIRASSESNILQMVAKFGDSFKLQPQKELSVYSGRISTKRQSNKVKPPKVSLVWKLGDTKSSAKGVDPLRCGKILSHLLPWKRATYWRSAWRSSTNFSGNSSLMITRKLLSSRKRAAIYVRSGRGFSLRRSKVISLAGTNLKWSKSMEKRSKKVDAEAARAIAAVHSVERPKTGAAGERIFRIGMFRYRMDPSRRSLHRITDEGSSDSATSKSEHGARKTYVPKRLLIGSDEYVRIGNGNQLVRDPKRRTRLLASEKVRWSLHTARMRLAKKRKFCQFFTRFGKCNKGEGKCPYIHDPSKIAVCTKFLNGLCGDPSCKLTHKVIPERMPDCSFFLQGSCSNENCAYRHVNVNPKAPICESFLRGYCAEGNECRRKHSYICPEFEATGSCPEGYKCKLYHPKKGKGKKRKSSKKQGNSRGRYFGSGPTSASDTETDMVEKLMAPKNGLQENQELGDFISLDVSDDEPGENIDPIAEPMSLSQGEAVNYQPDELDELIKPLRILDSH